MRGNEKGYFGGKQGRPNGVIEIPCAKWGGWEVSLKFWKLLGIQLKCPEPNPKKVSCQKMYVKQLLISKRGVEFQVNSLLLYDIYCEKTLTFTWSTRLSFIPLHTSTLSPAAASRAHCSCVSRTSSALSGRTDPFTVVIHWTFWNQI